MSRSGYNDDAGGWGLLCWRGAVTSAITGARGQAFLRELIEALDAMPVKELVADDLVTPEGQFCALGALGAKRGIDMSNIDPQDSSTVSGVFGIAEAMAREVVYENDEGTWKAETPAERWQRMRKWAEGWLIQKDTQP